MVLSSAANGRLIHMTLCSLVTRTVCLQYDSDAPLTMTTLTLSENAGGLVLYNTLHFHFPFGKILIFFPALLVEQRHKLFSQQNQYVLV